MASIFITILLSKLEQWKIVNELMVWRPFRNLVTFVKKKGHVEECTLFNE
ncbi:hypothetical protein ADICYQ_4627 [Cyclobacterium qasimii M12-11B]|uniref:Uncharacterized protein n=1 Tax=Cyclobacterium qasimii M12-11B TaxID=641524 RepID=S7WQU0_9BACT|nr:hypothetical protein ADICYQ_4627 [Cyclobacterium qasimii M12-11B]